jgi:valyl-tRNA synthetase
VGAVRIDLDTSDAIDVGAERRRLDKDLAVARKELAQAAAKLDNEQFLAKAPEAVIARIRDRRVAAEADIARLEAQLAALPG